MKIFVKFTNDNYKKCFTKVKGVYKNAINDLVIKFNNNITRVYESGLWESVDIVEERSIVNDNNID